MIPQRESPLPWGRWGKGGGGLGEGPEAHCPPLDQPRDLNLSLFPLLRCEEGRRETQAGKGAARRAGQVPG